MPFLAALGWVLAVYFFVQLVRATRTMRLARMQVEALMRTHRPDDYKRYVAKLAERGMKPLTHHKEP